MIQSNFCEFEHSLKFGCISPQLGQRLVKNSKIFKYTQIFKNCQVTFLDKIILDYMAKLDISSQVWTMVNSVFVKYLKAAFFVQNWWNLLKLYDLIAEIEFGIANLDNL